MGRSIASSMERIIKLGTMKVTLEISNKFIEIAKGVILGAVNDEKDEQKVIDIAERLKTRQEPVDINLSDLYDGSSSADAANLSQMNIVMATFAMHAIMKEAGE